MAAKKRAHLVPVNDPSEIPLFATEGDEAAFWATHEFGPGMFERVEPLVQDELPPSRPRSLTVRLDADQRRRLETVARKKGVQADALLQRFVTERLYEEEKREGLVKSTR